MNTATPQLAKGLEDKGTADALRAGGASAMDATQGLRPEQRIAMISQAAYYSPQRPGFEEALELL
jgi:hypothetical protein